MERKYEIGAHVVYVDPFRIPRDALITVWWNPPNEIKEYVSPTGEPGCNLVFIEGDPARRDSCGRQASHSTSVVHKSKQAAPGNYWCWADELDEEQKATLNQDRG
jgi:hypothetical protein